MKFVCYHVIDSTRKCEYCDEIDCIECEIDIEDDVFIYYIY